MNHSNKKYVISVIGAGALGKLYGGLLFLAGHEVHCLLRSEYAAIKQQGFYELKFNELQKTFVINNPNLYQDPKELPPSDLVIIAVKTTANEHLKALLAHTLKKETIILIIQNGMGNEEYVNSLFPNHTILAAISYAAVTRREGALAEVFALSELRMALFNTQDQSILKEIEDLFPPEISPKFFIYESYKQMRWKKLIWNTPFCALSIVFNKPTHILASQGPYVDIIRSIMHEIQKIAHSEGIEIRDEDIENTIAGSCNMKNYYPSMYWDYVNGQMIEKEYIMDHVLAIAKTHNIRTPTLEKMINELNHLLCAYLPR